ncbi:MAG: hypothetical protein F7C32_02380 [Desulfurococcales archaeon]|nr:hypothetical protein [Desulfurococcales archaeon]
MSDDAKYYFSILMKCKTDTFRYSIYEVLVPEIENPENKRIGTFQIRLKDEGVEIEVETRKFSDLLAVSNSLFGLLHIIFSALSSGSRSNDI